MSQILRTFRAQLPLGARVSYCNAKGIELGFRNTNVHFSYTQATVLVQVCPGPSELGFRVFPTTSQDQYSGNSQQLYE